MKNSSDLNDDSYYFYQYRGNDRDDYKLDILTAIFQVKNIEGDHFHAAIQIPNPIYRYLRFREYPYQFSLLDRLIELKVPDKDLQRIMNEQRLYPYFSDYIFKKDDI